MERTPQPLHDRILRTLTACNGEINRRYLPYRFGVTPEILEAALQDLKRDGRISLVTVMSRTGRPQQIVRLR
ncbi:MAG: hypothetical protein GYA39_04225 [Methanothrix sp.]|nr:hypothetical protein [Methanothrix sp.]